MDSNSEIVVEHVQSEVNRQNWAILEAVRAEIAPILAERQRFEDALDNKYPKE